MSAVGAKIVDLQRADGGGERVTRQICGTDCHRVLTIGRVGEGILDLPGGAVTVAYWLPVTETF